MSRLGVKEKTSKMCITLSVSGAFVDMVIESTLSVTITMINAYIGSALHEVQASMQVGRDRGIYLF